MRATFQIPAGFTNVPVDGGIAMSLSAKLIKSKSRRPRLYYMGQNRNTAITRLSAHLTREGFTTKFVQSQADGSILMVVAPIAQIGHGACTLMN